MNGYIAFWRGRKERLGLGGGVGEKDGSAHRMTRYQPQGMDAGINLVLPLLH